MSRFSRLAHNKKLRGMEVFSDEQLEYYENCEESTFNMAILARSLKASSWPEAIFPVCMIAGLDPAAHNNNNTHSPGNVEFSQETFLSYFSPLPGQRYLLTRFLLFPSFLPFICPFRRAYEDKSNLPIEPLKPKLPKFRKGAKISKKQAKRLSRVRMYDYS